ncbi:MAG TPA: NAD(P)-binding domain-containing protein, partial [Bryobacteraceae bacterium]
MAKLGFLGLGLMGYPMARNLLRAGHNVAVWSKTTSKSAQLASEAGAVACATPAEVAKQADVVFLCVGDTAMVEEVLLGKDSIIEGGRKGMAVVDTSTILPSASVKIGEKFAEK